MGVEMDFSTTEKGEPFLTKNTVKVTRYRGTLGIEWEDQEVLSSEPAQHVFDFPISDMQSTLQSQQDDEPGYVNLSHTKPLP